MQISCQSGSKQIFLVLSFITEIPVLKANSVHPDQMLQSAASDLGIHCLPMSLLWGTSHQWVNYTSVTSSEDLLKYTQNKNTEVKL